MKLKVLLADDHALFRDGMRYVLQQLSDQVDILCTGNLSDALKAAETNPAIDIALLDLNMPGSDGVGSIRVFNQLYPHIPIVVVSGSENRSEIEWAMEYGAMGFISKTTTAKEMVIALRAVLDGDVYFPLQLLANDDNNVSAADADSNYIIAARHGLTKRQIESLQLLAEGLSNKEISLRMNLADGTIKAHIAAAYQTLKVSNRTDAVRKAHKLGLITIAREGSNEV
jgi:DNA-binding NarL/FixJ family response regulator